MCADFVCFFKTWINRFHLYQCLSSIIKGARGKPMISEAHYTFRDPNSTSQLPKSVKSAILPKAISSEICTDYGGFL